MKKTQVEKILGISTYVSSSVVTITANKYILSTLKARMPFMLLTLQSIIIVCIVALLRLLRLLHLSQPCAKTLLHWTPLSVCLSLMVYTGARSIEYLPISAFTLLKNSCIVLNAATEKLLFGKTFHRGSWLSFAFVFVSSYAGDAFELEAVFFGYVWMFLNVVSTSLYAVLMRIYACEAKSKIEPVFYCNLLSLPQLFLCSFFFDSFDACFVLGNRALVTAIAVSGISAFFASYTTAWCLVLLSSTSLSMLGALNKLAVSLSGPFLIGSEKLCVLKVVSLITGALAGLLYSKNINSE